MTRTIARGTFTNPSTGESLTFYTTDLKTHRQTKALLQKHGYELADEQEELANTENADEALMIAKHISPIVRGTRK